MTESPSLHGGDRTCPRCGGAFQCGAGSPGGCWCAALPNVMPIPSIGTSDCLCPKCLAEDVARRSTTKGQPRLQESKSLP